MKNSVMSNNEFVKKGQNTMKSMMGDRPPKRAEEYKFDANMTNTGDSADSFSVKLTSGIDKKAFPVK